jgi:hypothetical protein
MAIDLTVKRNIVRFIDTIVAEAGKYHGPEDDAAQVDPELRPYSGGSYLPNQFLAVAKKTLEITNSYHAAALDLTNHHRKLIEAKDPDTIALISTRIHDLLEQVKEVDQIRVNKNISYYYSGCAALFGLGFLGIGYLVPANWMKTVGKVVLVVATIWLASSFFWHRKDQETITNYYAIIRTSGESIQRDLGYYDDQMVRLPDE